MPWSSYSFSLSHNILHAFLLSPIRATCPAHLRRSRTWLNDASPSKQVPLMLSVLETSPSLNKRHDAVCWIVAPCSLVDKYDCSTRTCRFLLQSSRTGREEKRVVRRCLYGRGERDRGYVTACRKQRT
jgi:hypothetical protein